MINSKALQLLHLNTQNSPIVFNSLFANCVLERWIFLAIYHSTVHLFTLQSTSLYRMSDAQVLTKKKQSLAVH